MLSAVTLPCGSAIYHENCSFVVSGSRFEELCTFLLTPLVSGIRRLRRRTDQGDCACRLRRLRSSRAAAASMNASPISASSPPPPSRHAPHRASLDGLFRRPAAAAMPAAAAGYAGQAGGEEGGAGPPGGGGSRARGRRARRRLPPQGGPPLELSSTAPRRGAVLEPSRERSRSEVVSAAGQDPCLVRCGQHAQPPAAATRKRRVRRWCLASYAAPAAQAEEERVAAAEAEAAERRTTRKCAAERYAAEERRRNECAEKLAQVRRRVRRSVRRRGLRPT